MAQHKVKCPGCGVVLKFNTPRPEIECPKCSTRFALKARPKATPPAPPAPEPAPLPENPLPISMTAPRGSSRRSPAAVIAFGIAAALLLAVGGYTFYELTSVQTTSQPQLSDRVVASRDGARRHEVRRPNRDEFDPSDAAPAWDRSQLPVVESEPSDTLAAFPLSASGLNGSSSSGGPLPLRYNWRVGQRHVYDYSLVAQVNGLEETTTGQCTYRVVSREYTPSEEESKATGTAFVITSDGYLITCAHVVEDALRLTVNLGDEKFAATVEAVDAEQDLALIKIKTRGLTALQLSPAADVELGQQVSVVGYPLSDLLGKRVKMTNGAVSGESDIGPDGDHRFQIDATVNPGNSGGPVIDRSGHVVGVASALLSGFRIDEVGFATPISEVRTLLTSAGVTPDGRLSSAPTTGPGLARAVVPGVAYVEVELDPSVGETFKINYQARQQTTGFRRQPAKSESGSFVVDRFGGVTEFEGDLVLPHQLDSIGVLILESLRHEGKRKWGGESGSTLTLNNDSPGLGVPRRALMPTILGRNSEPQTYDAIEDCKYRLVEANDEAFVVAKDYLFKTTEGTPPKLHQSGKGRWVFDRRIGMPSSGAFTATANYDGDTHAQPYTLTFTRRDAKHRDSLAGERERMASQIEQLARDFGHAMGENAGRQPHSRPGASQRPSFATRSFRNHVVEFTYNNRKDQMPLDEAIRELQEAVRKAEEGQPIREQKTFHAVCSLAVIDPDQDRKREVGDLLVALYRSNAYPDSSGAIGAMRRWMSAEHVDLLADILNSRRGLRSIHERREIIAAISGFDTPKVREALFKQYDERLLRTEAERAIIAIGSDVQQDVLKMLDSRDWQWRKSAIKILSQVGTEAALPRLREEAENGDTLFYIEDLKRLIRKLEHESSI